MVKKKQKIKKTTEKTAEKTAQSILKDIVDFINTADTYDASNLWFVLSALRGPDDSGNVQGDKLKDFTTARIRSAIGLKPHYSDYFKPFTVNEDGKGVMRHGTMIYDHKVSFHFANHVEQAVSALQNLGYNIAFEDFSQLTSD